ncbi:hypothetical protein JW851_00685 [Candidatus Woesearchaeota archaeon]|nr:hypothetical protein [Candidatus Woesearchaeota archaeon]
MLPHHKEIRLTKKSILHMLRDLDMCLEGIQKKVKLYGLGGTVLVLSDLRHSSKDVDFITSREDFRTLSGHITEIEWKKKIQFDIFPDGSLPKYRYSDYNIHAKKAPFEFKNIELFYLDTIDLVLTKALASRDTDIKDIELLAPSKNRVPKEELIRRFKNIKPAPKEANELKNNFNKFINEYYK